MTLPNFLVIGAAKAGTTALYHYLKQHPQVYMSAVKEPRFFAFENEKLPPEDPIHRTTINDLASYEALFEEVSGEKAIGEASPAYLVEPKAAKRIQHYIPDAKLIAILRNPVERAYSHFLHLIKNNYESCYDFAHALQNINEIVIGKWVVRNDYIQFGFYYEQLQRYYKRFDENQIKIFLFEDLKSNMLHVMREIFEFLDVDDKFIPDVSIIHNVSGIPKSRTLHSLLSEPNLIRSSFSPIIRLFLPKTLRQKFRIHCTNVNLQKPDLPIDTRNYLINLYRDDILKLEALIQRDLTAWLNVEH